MSPLVSIITVTKNLIDAGRSDWFRQCVESVRMQDYPNIEHLIIDGASTDGTIDLFKNLGVTYFSEPDKGIYNACNKGIAKASGKYINFLTSDDYYCAANGISSCVANLERYNADISYASILLETEKGQEISLPHFYSFFRGCPFGIPAGFFKKSLYDELGYFDEKYTIAADYKFILQALMNGKKFIEGSQKPFVVLRLGGFSNNNKEKLINENISIIKEQLNLDHNSAEIAYKYGFLKKKKIDNIVKNKNISCEKEIRLHCLNNYMKYIRKKLITVHLRKGKRCFRFLGITFYNEEKK